VKKTIIIILVAVTAALGYYWLSQRDSSAVAEKPGGTVQAAGSVPIKSMVTMVDLGADRCIPCKMMAPILESLEKEYRGRAAIVFLDVWKDPAPAKHFGIRAIPTQIFFDANGKEVARHEGFLSQEAIVAQLKAMGVE